MVHSGIRQTGVSIKEEYSTISVMRVIMQKLAIVKYILLLTGPLCFDKRKAPRRGEKMIVVIMLLVTLGCFFIR